MKRHFASANERSSAQFTDEGSFARVNPSVLVHVALLGKRLSAEVTRKRFVARMHAKVGVKISALRESKEHEKKFYFRR